MTSWFDTCPICAKKLVKDGIWDKCPEGHYEEHDAFAYWTVKIEGVEISVGPQHDGNVADERTKEVYRLLDEARTKWKQKEPQ